MYFKNRGFDKNRLWLCCLAKKREAFIYKGLAKKVLKLRNNGNEFSASVARKVMDEYLLKEKHWKAED